MAGVSPARALVGLFMLSARSQHDRRERVTRFRVMCGSPSSSSAVSSSSVAKVRFQKLQKSSAEGLVLLQVNPCRTVASVCGRTAAEPSKSYCKPGIGLTIGLTVPGMT